MNCINNTLKKQKNKHLTIEMYEKIQSVYNHYIFSKDKQQPKTDFMKDLAMDIGTTLSNIYSIIKDGLIEVLCRDFESRIEFNANTAFNIRSKKNCISNSLKLNDALPFIDLVIKDFRNPMNMNSIDEIIHDFLKNRQDEIKDMVTICTTTFYNYLDLDLIPGFSKYELPMKMKRKQKNESKKGKTKPKGTSIEERPFKMNDRSIFGHWEGDTIVGSNKIKNSGAILTLVERQTRFQITVKMKNRKSKTVLKAFSEIASLYPDLNVLEIFKSITFDNGVEFAKWKLIEKNFKTKIFFAHPYCSCERGSNENCNKLLRIFVPKSTNINSYSIDYVMNANELINQKIRKILDYKSSLDLFNDQLALLAI